MWESLNIAIAIIDAAADFFVSTKRIILVQIFFFAMSMFVLMFWMGAQLCVYSLNDFKHPDVAGSQSKEIVWKGSVKFMSVFLFFALMWTLKFIDDKTKFIAMTSAATYYFDSNAEKEGSASVCKAISFAYGSHLGSIALGSFCVTVITFLTFIVESL